MNKEKFLAKGVARKYEKGEVLFNVESLHEHYEGINYHLTDILEGGFIRPNDVLDGDIREIEVAPTMEVEVTQETLDLNPQLVAEGIEVGEILTVSAEEDATHEELPVWVNAEFTSGNEPADDLILPEIATEEIEVVDEVIMAETPEE